MLEPDPLCSPLPNGGRGVGGEGWATLEIRTDAVQHVFWMESESMEACLTPTVCRKRTRAAFRLEW